MGLRALAECLKAELTGTGVYVGIAYVGITENEQGKTIYNAKGEKFVRPDFKMLGMQSIADVAADILWMIRTQRFKHVFTFPGKLQAFLNSLSRTGTISADEGLPPPLPQWLVITASLFCCNPVPDCQPVSGRPDRQPDWRTAGRFVFTQQFHAYIGVTLGVHPTGPAATGANAG
jgi:hypothetical protein